MNFQSLKIFTLEPHYSYILRFAVFIQNFAKIRQSAVELWPKLLFSKVRDRHLGFKSLNFGDRKDFSYWPNL